MNLTQESPRRSPLREIVAYLSLTYGIALAIAVAMPDFNINKLLTIFAPVIAVTVVTFTLVKRGSRRELWGGLGLTRTGMGSVLPALLIPIALCGSAYGTALLIGAGRLDVDIDASRLGDRSLSLLIGLLLMTVVLLGEEIGWRGFLLPRVQEVTGKRRAAVLTGFAHGLFHLPLILVASTYDAEGARWIAAPAAVVVITAGGVLYAWLRDRSGSIWPVAFAHSVVNTVFDLGAAGVVATSPASMAYVAGETGFATLGAVAAVAVLLLARARVWQDAPAREPAPRVPALV